MARPKGRSLGGLLFPTPHASMVALPALVIVMAVAMRADFPPGEIANHEGGSRSQAIGRQIQEHL